jgi:hypothetical protein
MDGDNLSVSCGKPDGCEEDCGDLGNLHD